MIGIWSVRFIKDFSFNLIEKLSLVSCTRFSIGLHVFLFSPCVTCLSVGEQEGGDGRRQKKGGRWVAGAWHICHRRQQRSSADVVVARKHGALPSAFCICSSGQGTHTDTQSEWQIHDDIYSCNSPPPPPTAPTHRAIFTFWLGNCWGSFYGCTGVLLDVGVVKHSAVVVSLLFLSIVVVDLLFCYIYFCCFPLIRFTPYLCVSAGLCVCVPSAIVQL